ncbi:DEAD/DEAH box helicase family protein [Sulfobacillus thermosulfidooxidans]|uniref:DEAD/DEAH box helicase family protein n=1 Tax=Sulfobacillus thermosulfidooxidans TaxID=28034 RepID=UPI001593CDDB|nr:DEAD/DEAH box helicase family protein [Sulfobacillus thermosulfidooxidans]
MLALRPYQQEAVQAVRSAALQGQRRILCVLATGAGKTVIAAHLAQQTKGRVLMVVNRDELVKQSVQKLALFVPPDQIGIVQGAEHGETARYVVASIQTLARPARLHALLTTDQTDPFRLVIVDESHLLSPLRRRDNRDLSW